MKKFAEKYHNELALAAMVPSALLIMLIGMVFKVPMNIRIPAELIALAVQMAAFIIYLKYSLWKPKNR